MKKINFKMYFGLFKAMKNNYKNLINPFNSPTWFCQS